MAACLDLARASQVGGINGERREWIRAGDDRMVGDGSVQVSPGGNVKLHSSKCARSEPKKPRSTAAAAPASTAGATSRPRAI